MMKQWKFIIPRLPSVVRGLKTRKNIPVLTMFTKDNCQLCDEALEILEPYKHTIQLEKVDIKQRDNKQWFNKYRYDIPVFHFNGQFLMKHRVDFETLNNAIHKFETMNDNEVS